MPLFLGDSTGFQKTINEEVNRRGLLLAGAVCKRWSTFKAGFASAEDPHQTVGPQRDRLEARNREAEIDGPAISG